MNQIFRTPFFQGISLILLGLMIMFSLNPLLRLEFPTSLLNLNTIFISILIEALPFVLIGVLIAGFIQIFVTDDHIRRWIPRSRMKAIVMSCIIGALFPACECGIVPIVRRLIGKGVPLYAAIGFMLTGPLINPIVIASTYMAFGNNASIAAWRMGLGFIIALIIAFLVSYFFKGTQLKETNQRVNTHSHEKTRLKDKIWSVLTHSIDEFFDMAKFLILGALLASAIQTYMPAKSLLEAGSGPVSSLLVMMGLAYVLSLCSEADAFIGSSFNSIMPTPSVLGFLILGPMIDFKNTLMMLSVFRVRFVLGIVILTSTTVFLIIYTLQDYISRGFL